MAYAGRVFLSAEWRDLVMLNYEVEPGLLNPYVPSGTTLDSFQGRTYISLVGFRFCRTKLLGYFPVPCHVNFEEVNLRFYVRRKAGNDRTSDDRTSDHRTSDDRENTDRKDNDRRGVVFIAEVVPRRAIAATARLVYGENYKYFPMRHCIETGKLNNQAEYQWQVGSRWCTLSAQTAGVPAQPPEGSLEQFITEHYWGYSAQPAGGCVEYHVSHVPWKVWATTKAGFDGEVNALYGRELATVLQRQPDSAFVADGSSVLVFAGRKVR